MYWLTQAPKRWRLVIVLGAYQIGLVLGALVHWSVSPFWLLIAVVVIGAFFLTRPFWLATGILASSLLLIGVWWARSTMISYTLTQPITYEGSARVEQAQLSNPPQTRLRLRLQTGTHDGQSVEGTVYDWTTPVGSDVLIKTTITPNRYASATGRSVVGELTGFQLEKVMAPPRGLYAFRQLLINRLGASLPEPAASLAVGLLTGTNDDFDAYFKQDLQRTGTTHIVAVSGANLTIVALFLLRILKRYGRWWALTAALWAVVAYTIVAGFNPSVVRGTVMAVVSLLALTLGRITHRVPLILITATILSLLYPLGSVYSLSWQLSFLAFIGIIFLGEPLAHALRRFGPAGHLLAETLAAELLVAPLIFYGFGDVSIISPIVNLVILLFVPLAMAASFVTVLGSLIAIPLGRILAWVSYPILSLLILPIQWSSRLPFAAYHIANRPVWFLSVSYGIIGLIVILVLRKHHEAH